jgi:O-antigen/teichoic acid export membrane protein
MIDEALLTQPSSHPLGTRILRGATAGFSISILANIFLFIGQILIPRLLSRVEYAQFTVCISFVAIMALAADLGMNPMFTRLFAEAEEEISMTGQDRRGMLLGSALALRLFMSFVVAALIITVGSLLYSTSMVRNMAILLLTLIISSRILIVRSVGESVLRGRGKYYLAVFFALPDAITFALLLYWGQYYALDLTNVLWIYVLCNVPGFIMLVISIVRWIQREHIILSVDISTIVNMLRTAIPLSLGTAFVTIHAQIDSLLLDKLSTPMEVSSYGATTRLFSAVVPFAVVLAGIAGPELTRLLRRGDSERSRRLTDLSLRVLMVLAGAIALFLTTASRDLMRIMLGDKYVSSGSLLALTGWLLIPIFIATFLSDVCVAAGKFWIPTVYAAIIMVSVVVGDLLFIGPYGAMGAMASKLIALSFGVASLIWFSRGSKYLNARNFVSALLRVSAAAGTALFALWIIRSHETSDWLVSAGILIVYFSVIHFTRILSVNEALSLLKKFQSSHVR